MTEPLINQECVPCKIGARPLTAADFPMLMEDLGPGWSIEDDKQLVRTFDCGGFSRAVRMIDEIAQAAEEQGHHPDLNLHDFKMLTVRWWTHKINGLHQNDFIMAARTSQIFDQLPAKT